MSAEVPLEELSSTFARIQGMLLTEEAVVKAVDLLALAAKDAIPGSLGAGVSLIDEQGRRTSTGYTDMTVKAADHLQYEVGQGPCLSAWAGNRVVRSNDLTTEDRWPLWTPGAIGLGVRSVLSAPLIHRTQTLGAIKVYSAVPDAYDERSWHLLTLFSGPAATLLGNVQASELPRKMSRALKDAVHSRDSIAVAKGILMERTGMTEDEAMAELLRQARRDSQPLIATADQIVAGAGNRQD